MIWILPLVVFFSFVGLWILYKKLLKSMLIFGFKKMDDEVALPPERWELARLGVKASQLYKNKDGVSLFLFDVSVGNRGMAIPFYLLHIGGLSFLGHHLSLTNLFVRQYDPYRKSKESKLINANYNVYTLGNDNEIDKFISFVSLYGKRFSIEVNQGEMVFLVSIPKLKELLDVIEMAKTKFGMADETPFA